LEEKFNDGTYKTNNRVQRRLQHTVGDSLVRVIDDDEQKVIRFKQN